MRRCGKGELRAEKQPSTKYRSRNEPAMFEAVRRQTKYTELWTLWLGLGAQP
jgi:hypothetical protein